MPFWLVVFFSLSFSFAIKGTHDIHTASKAHVETCAILSKWVRHFTVLISTIKARKKEKSENGNDRICQIWQQNARCSWACSTIQTIPHGGRCGDVQRLLFEFSVDSFDFLWSDDLRLVAFEFHFMPPPVLLHVSDDDDSGTTHSKKFPSLNSKI